MWYPDLKKYGEKYQVLAVVGNKCDLYENDNLADEEQAKAFAKEINGTFMLTSAKCGDGIDKLFDTLTDIYLGPDFNPKAKEMIKNRGLKKENDDKKKSKKCC